MLRGFELRDPVNLAPTAERVAVMNRSTSTRQPRCSGCEATDRQESIMNNPLKALLVAAATVALLAPATAQAASSPDAYCFAKHATSPGVWVGTYAPVAEDGTCDAIGGLPMASHLTAAPVQTGQVLHIAIQWQF